MNEAKLKGMFLKELYKGRFTNILLFYDEQESMLAVGVDKEKDITFKEDCLITVSVKGRVKVVCQHFFEQKL